MKHFRLLFIFIAAICLGSCQNNGDIGTLYGQWAVDEVAIDGTPDTEYPCKEVYFKFQNNIVILSRIAGYSSTDYVGTWTRTDKTITLDFDHYRGEERPSGQIPAALLIPAQTATTFTIERESSSRLVLSYPDPSDRIIRFTLRKLN